MDEKKFQDAVQADLFDTLYGMTQEEFKNHKRSFGRPMMFSVVFVDQAGSYVPMEIFAPLGKIKAKRAEWDAFLARVAKSLSDAEHTYHPMTWEEECKLFDEIMEKAKDRRYQKLIDNMDPEQMGQA